ncbi:hypothetical protein BJ742DRAFT_800961 [Cladochytrium replicatum]|nr:hypothetical protein BJ742DRAFT_800961 [Cladochytrium replicatum]
MLSIARSTSPLLAEALLSASRSSILVPPLSRSFHLAPNVLNNQQVWPSTGYGRSSGYPPQRIRALPLNTVIKFVPQQEAWIVERMGRFQRILEPGLAILVPFLDRIKYVKSLKEQAVEIGHQAAITQDNVTILLDGVLYYRITDPYKASYGIEDCDFAIAQLAQTTMRAEIGRLTLDRTLAERTQLNHFIVESINVAAADWGLKCLRYEIRDIHPPENVVAAMHQQVSADRKKRAEILDSEGTRQAAINVAEGQKQAVILQSEAERENAINRASGEAAAIKLRAEASAEAINRVALALREHAAEGSDAVSLSIAEKYVAAFEKLAKESTTVIVPGNPTDVGGMVAQVMGTFEAIKGDKRKGRSVVQGSFTESGGVRSQ